MFHLKSKVLCCKHSTQHVRQTRMFRVFKVFFHKLACICGLHVQSTEVQVISGSLLLSPDMVHMSSWIDKTETGVCWEDSSTIRHCHHWSLYWRRHSINSVQKGIWHLFVGASNIWRFDKMNNASFATLSKDNKLKKNTIYIEDWQLIIESSRLVFSIRQYAPIGIGIGGEVVIAGTSGRLGGMIFSELISIGCGQEGRCVAHLWVGPLRNCSRISPALFL